MANNFDILLQKIVGRSLLVLRNRLVLPQVVNSDFSTEAAKKGQIIQFERAVNVGTRDVTPGPTPPSNVDYTPDAVQLALNYWKQTDPIHLTDKELMEIDASTTFLPKALQSGVETLASDVNASIFAEYKGIFGFWGTPGTIPFSGSQGVKPASQSRKILNQQRCPRDPRFGIINVDAEAYASEVDQFANAASRGSDVTKRTGELGFAYGATWLMDDQVPYHTAGTIATDSSTRVAAVNNSGGYAADNSRHTGTSYINIDKGAASSITGTIVVGDIISFSGHTQTYTVVANSASSQYSSGAYTFATNAINGLAIQPALQKAIVDNETITVQASHYVHMLIHKDAFAFANRPLADSGMGISQSTDGQFTQTYQDEVSKIIMRISRSRQYKQWSWDIDMLWGAKLVDPRLATRIAG